MTDLERSNDTQGNSRTRHTTCKRRRVTIADVAKAAGVSKTLVSFVLNGRPDVGEETRKRIEAVIKELGYRPNRQARLLVQQRVGVVGLMLELRTYTDPLVLSFVAALGHRLAESGYGLLLVGDSRGTPLRAVKRAVEERMVDGLVLADVQRQDDRIAWLDEQNFPYVLFMGRRPDNRHFVDIDYDAAISPLVDHLVRRGYRRLALVTAPSHYQYIHRRETTFLRIAAERGLSVPDHWHLRGDLTEESGWKAGAALAAQSPRPDAVFAVTDILAIGTMRGLHDHGIRVPHDIAVAGFGGSPWGASMRPGLTTVAIPLDELGHAAADYILSLIDGRENTPGPVLVRPRLVVRDSA